MNSVVLNTSSSIFFAKLGLFPHLFRYFKVITSEEIYEEVKVGDELGYRDARILIQYFNDKKIEVKKTNRTKTITKEFKIKDNDASVISLAQEQECMLATEDKQIERICLVTRTGITNSALLIYWLWLKKEFEDTQVLLLLDLLLRSGYNKEICLKIKEKILGGG